MKLKSILLALIALSILTTSCVKNDDIKPSNNITTIEKTISGYNQLNVSDPFTVFVTFSDTEEKIQIEANSNLQQYIVVEKQDNQLVISLKDNLNIEGSSTLNVHITTKHLDTFLAEGASTIQLENELNESYVSIDLSGACSFTGSLFADEIDVELDGASNINIAGNSMNMEVSASGASNFHDYGFETNNFTCDINGASNVYLTIQETMNVVASGGSTVYYKGNGVIVDQVLSGGSTIKKMD